MADGIESSQQTVKQQSRVLVCDDSKIVRLTATKMLGDRCDLLLAEDGEQAWDLITQHPDIQVVFTDLGMPHLDGFGLIKRVRASTDERIRKLPLIVITGVSEDEKIKNSLFDIGATDFISKPFKQADLVARTEAHSNYQRITASLEKNASVDPLTGVLNATGLRAQLEKDYAFVNRHEGCLAVMVFEVDDFAAVHKKIGEKISSLIIKEVSKLLTKALRKEDSVGRDGLIKFSVSLPMAKGESVLALARRLCAKIDSFKLKVGETTITLTSSAGISTAPAGSQVSATDLLSFAEQALAEARQRGAGQIRLFEHEKPAATASKPLSLDSLLEHIAKGQQELSSDTMLEVIRQLAPLIALMDETHKSKLLR